MMEISTSRIKNIENEDAEAKAYWAEPGVQPLRYQLDPHYIGAIAEIIEVVGARSIFEFGCSAGRNLAFLCKRFGDNPEKSLFVRGIDINSSAIDYGRSTFDLDISLGDEGFLASLEEGSFDLVFTTSVLDHMPDPEGALKALMNISTRYGVFIEPSLAEGASENGKVSEISTEWSRRNDNSVNPFTYLHNYPALFEVANCRVVMKLPMPTHLNRAGPFYSLWLIEKKRAAVNVNCPAIRDVDGLRQRIISTAMLLLLSNIQKISGGAAKQGKQALKFEKENKRLMDEVQKLEKHQSELALEFEKENKKLVGIVKNLKKQKTDANRKGQQRVQSQLAYRLGRVLIDNRRRLLHWPLLPLKFFRVWRKYKLDLLSMQEPHAANYIKIFKAHGAKKTIALVRKNNKEKSLSEQARALIITGKLLADKGFQEAEYLFCSAAVALDESIATLRALFWLANKQGKYEEACRVIREIENFLGPKPSKSEEERLNQLKRQPAYQLATLELIENRRDLSINPFDKRICYVLHNSLPHSSGGYATRSHGLATGLMALGYEVICLTRPGFPVDIKPELIASQISNEDIIEGVRYIRTLKPTAKGKRAYDYVAASASELEKKFREYKPAYVVAASNSRIGLMALIAARRLGLPFVYEARGFWEITRMSRDNDYKYTDNFAIQSLMEAAVANNADHVLTLTEPMREELVRRGVDKSKITLLPNSCDPERFRPGSRDQYLAEQLGIPDGIPVIGYIGTFVDYEGLEDLVDACVLLKKRGLEFRLLLVGNENTSGNDKGPITTQIIESAERGGIYPWLIMPGRIPHEEVERYYSLVDIVPFPRKAWPVCEMVSPMKPLEAMAMEKAVVVSSVRALTEMVSDGETGLVYEKENNEKLADVLQLLVKDETLRHRLGEMGEAGLIVNARG